MLFLKMSERGPVRPQLEASKTIRSRAPIESGREDPDKSTLLRLMYSRLVFEILGLIAPVRSGLLPRPRYLSLSSTQIDSGMLPTRRFEVRSILLRPSERLRPSAAGPVVNL